MIDPTKITNYNRSIKELQEFLLFAIVVAGKNSKIQAKKLDDFLHEITVEYELLEKKSPKSFFHALRSLGKTRIDTVLRKVRMGQYKRITNAFESVSHLNNLQTCTFDQLEKFDGIGGKTSRFFVLHTQKNARCAVLDTHILKHIKAEHPDEYVRNIVPKSTPSGNLYNVLEHKFLKMVDKTSMTVAEYDLKIWKQYAKG